MGPIHQCPGWSLYLLLLLFLFPRQCWSLSVAFESEQPLHIILSENLILEAKIETAKGDEVKKITWEKETAGGASPSTVTVAEFPGKVIDSRITVEENGAMLKVTNFDHKDRGVYTITVFTKTGSQTSARRDVQEYVAVHHVSVAINVSHSLLSCGEAWGTDPHFSWLHESGVISEEVGRMSLDGKVLYLKAAPCGHFTCIVSNSLGHSSATYTAEPCERQGSGATVAVVVLVILLVCAAALAFFVWRRHRKHTNRGERLREHHEDQL